MFMPSGCIKNLAVLNLSIHRSAILLSDSLSELIDTLQSGIKAENKQQIVRQTENVRLAGEAIVFYYQAIAEDLKFLKQKAIEQ